MPNEPCVLITGASAGIGAVFYADRFANKRGQDLVLVARGQVRMEALADRLSREIGIGVEILRADLTDPTDLMRVETRLRKDLRIGILVNNAGTAPAGGFVDQTPDEVARIVNLNAMAPVRLASAVAPRFAQAGTGAIGNIGSVVGLSPEYGSTEYGATKAFILFLSQSLHAELLIRFHEAARAGDRRGVWQPFGSPHTRLPLGCAKPRTARCPSERNCQRKRRREAV